MQPVHHSSIGFRYLLTLLILGRRRATVAWMVTELERTGVQVWGRPSKVVSDVLRAEVNRGRVRRVGRGVYEAGVIPRSTEWRMRRRVLEERRASSGGMPDPRRWGGEPIRRLVDVYQDAARSGAGSPRL